jgi:small subunit ribosomal protein S1
MTLNKFTRDQRPEKGVIFFAMPYGDKTLSNGQPFDFNQFYAGVLKKAVDKDGMTPLRADGIYGLQGVLETIWRGIQKAEVVVIDFTTKAPNVALEFAIALLLGKRIVILTQDPEDIPTDVRGLYRHISYGSGWDAVEALKEELHQQLQAIREEPASEMALIPLPWGGVEPVAARVKSVNRDFVVVEAEDGRRAVLGNADVDYTRIIKDMSRRFKEGSQLSGSFDVDLKGGTKYTLLAGLTNPWPMLANDHRPGTTFTGPVESMVEGVGAFVRVAHGVNGLVSKDFRSNGLSRGDRVRVTVTQVDAAARRIQLHLDEVVDAATVSSLGGTGPTADAPVVGTQAYGEVIKVAPEEQSRGGFLLVRLPGLERPAILHCTKMTEDLREDLKNGQVDVGEEIPVEVITVDAAHGRVSLKDLPDEPATQAVA